MGDTDGGLYVRPGIPEFFRDTAVPAADVITPNEFEARLFLSLRLPRLDGGLLAGKDRGRSSCRLLGVYPLHGCYPQVRQRAPGRQLRNSLVPF